MSIFLAIIGFIIFIIGIFLFFGAGWAFILIDLISAFDGSHSSPSENYSAIQKEHSTKNPTLKLIGLFLIFIGIGLFLYSFMTVV